MPLTLDLETSGIDPTSNWITAIGVLWPGGLKEFTAPAHMFRINPIEAEHELLEAATRWVYHSDYLLTYNGESFDLPFLKTRLLFQGFQDTDIPFMDTKYHLDLFPFTKEMNNNVRISKDFAASKFADIYCPRNSNGAFLSAVYRQKIVTDEEHVDMLGHLALDLVATWKMYNKFRTYPEFWKFYEGMYPDFREWCKA